jgi:hypothetical protein
MAVNQVTPNPLDRDDSTVITGKTPPETIGNDLDSFSGTDLGTSSIPSEGSKFIIRSVSCGRVITLLKGKVVLAYPDDSGGSVHWECVKSRGWYGFRNCVTPTFLGYDEDRRLCCSAKEQKGWENFHIGPRPEGGSVLLMAQTGNAWTDLWYGRELWPVGVKWERGVESLAIIGTENPCIGWEFIEVQ